MEYQFSSELTSETIVHTFCCKYLWKYLLTVSYTMKCMDGFEASTREGLVPFHNADTPSSLAIFTRASVRRIIQIDYAL